MQSEITLLKRPRIKEVGRNKSVRAVARTGVSGRHPQIRRKRHLALRAWMVLFQPTLELAIVDSMPMVTILSRFVYKDESLGRRVKLDIQFPPGMEEVDHAV